MYKKKQVESLKIFPKKLKILKKKNHCQNISHNFLFFSQQIFIWFFKNLFKIFFIGMFKVVFPQFARFERREFSDFLWFYWWKFIGSLIFFFDVGGFLTVFSIALFIFLACFFDKSFFPHFVCLPVRPSQLLVFRGKIHSKVFFSENQRCQKLPKP